MADAFALHSAGEFVHSLADIMRKRGAVDVLSSDNGSYEVSNRVKEILRAFVIDDWQNEPCNPNQQFFERWWGVTKGLAKAVLGWSGANADEWFLVLTCVIYIRNRTAVKSLGCITPLEKLTGIAPDISIMLQMPYRQPVFFNATGDDVKFPSKPHERFGYFVGFSETVGHQNTFKILTADARKIVCRSRVRDSFFVKMTVELCQNF